ncbi:MAG: DUF1848 domain-containing protein [Eubacterium sp.]|nr:DUF1848 domain-containing protein [Eubacterium sp.]
MILNTGSRTDIPAFYSEWFINRIQEGFVMARNPFYPTQVTRFRIDPELLDIIAFCTKNPTPMLSHMDELTRFRQFWFVTITPYGKEIEPAVPDKREICESFRELSSIVGKSCVGWRYDPIFLSETYTVKYHLQAFEQIASMLEGYTEQVVISFIDLYEKTKRNYPEAKEVAKKDRLILGEAMAEIGSKHGMQIYTCLEGADLAPYGVNTGGCMTKEVLEHAIGEELQIPSGLSPARKGCRCLLGSDIGAYNTCLHFCRYCYANYDKESVLRNRKLHDPSSPLLVGHLLDGDQVREANQVRYRTGQLVFT